MKTYYKRHLPHIQLPDATYFVTFRLANTIPTSAIERLRAEQSEYEKCVQNNISDHSIEEGVIKIHRRLFYKIDSFLDRCNNNNYCLRKPEVAIIVSEAIHYYDNTAFDLIAYCIMPNHVHLIFSGLSIESNNKQSKLSEYPVADILKRIKSYTAREANKILNRTGKFWQHENYDHVIRNEKEKDWYIHYTLNNPVKAGLVKDFKDWQWHYCKHYKK